MKILGIDPSSNTGWCIIEDDKILDYGIIKSDASFELGQRLNLIAVEISRIVNKFKPDYIMAEDVILGISGVKTLALLGRISGVIIRECYKEMNKTIGLASPPEWKKGCRLGLKGNAIKVEIQLAVVKHFKLLTEDKIIQIQNNIDNWFLQIKESKLKKLPKKEITALKKEMDKAFRQYQKEIHSLSGISEDVADSLAIALYQISLI